MDYRRLGRSGLKLSEFSLGAWVTFGKQVGVDDAINLLACAYDHGINFFDNAEGYESGNAEKVMGEAISRLGWSRDSYAISSKVFVASRAFLACQGAKQAPGVSRGRPAGGCLGR